MPKLEQNPYDIRIRDLNIKRGTITRKDVAKRIKELPDDSECAEEIVVYEEETPDESPSEDKTSP